MKFIEKVRYHSRKLAAASAVTTMSVLASVGLSAEETGGTDAVAMVTEQFGTISTQVMTIIGIVVGIALGIFATVFGVKFAIGFFKSMTKQAKN